MLVKYLPPESATKTAVRNEIGEQVLHVVEPPTDHGPWSNDQLLLASIADGIAVLIWQQTQINGTRKLPPPAPIWRPGVARPVNRVLTSKGRAYLQRLRDERRG